MTQGDIVYYQYTHHLNSKSSTEIVKRGVFIRWVKSKPLKKRTDDAIVKLDGNKNPSKIHRSSFMSEQDYTSFINNKKQ